MGTKSLRKKCKDTKIGESRMAREGGGGKHLWKSAERRKKVFWVTTFDENISGHEGGGQR